MSILSKIFGDPNKKQLKKLEPIVDKINSLEAEFEKLSDEQLKNKTKEFKKRLENVGNEDFRSLQQALDDLLPEAYAAVREASKRTLGQRHFDVQLLAGIVLHRGEITEMKTGEGKTLAATLPIYLNALTGKGAHLVTVNDYLARRDATWMGKIYYALGLSVACIQQQGLSYLYDPETQHENTKTRKHENNSSHSEPRYTSGQARSESNKTLKQVQDDKEKEISKVHIEMKELRETPRKEAYQADITYGTNNEFGFDYLRDNMSQSLEGQVQRKLHYAIVDEVDSILIDEARTPLIISAPARSTTDMYNQFARIVPRLQEGRDYNIDEKMRAVTLTEEGIHKVELDLGVKNLYAEGGIRLVHHLEQALKAHTLFKRDKDYVVRPSTSSGQDEVVIVDEFTGRLMFGRRYSDGLHQAIEAKEGVKIQQESVTMATITFQNYFRLYEKLAGMTGTAKTEEEEFANIYGLPVLEIPTNKPMVRYDMRDRIYKNEQNKFQAVISEIKAKNELGQPVLVGTVSIEKNEKLGNLLRKSGIKHEILNAKNHAQEAEIIAQAGRLGAVTIATNMAGRGVDIVLGGNPPDNKQGEAVKRLGGLHVIGTERHESRRIDNQLRGRSGRQGDPGSSVFFISMEDDLMRIFGSDRMKNVMERLGVPDDMPIENNLISKSIESAQKKVEGHNFDIRKHLVEYDDVINKHREVIYKMRQEILSSDEFDDKNQNKGKILNMIAKEISEVVNFHTQSETQENWNLDEIYEVMDTIFPVPIEVRLKLQDIEEKLNREQETGNRKQNIKKVQLKGRESLIDYLEQLSEDAYESWVNNLDSHELAKDNKDFISQIEKSILLRSIDTLWVEHIDAMDHLRTGIGLRGYGQRDPLVEYKKDAFKMFNNLLTNIRKQVVYSVFKVNISIGPGQQKDLKFSGVSKTQEQGYGQFSNSTMAASLASSQQSSTLMQDQSADRLTKHKEGVKHAPISKSEKIGRNDPCPCGAINPQTGNPYKYKKCGMINASHHKR